MNPEKLAEKLRNKGWSEDDIEKALHILTQPVQDPLSVKIMYWTALLAALLGNLFVAIIIVPFLLLINNSLIYFVIFILAFAFGALFNSLLSQLEAFGGTYIVATLFIPSLAVINALFMFGLSKVFISTFNLPLEHTIQSTIAITYALVFSLPFIFSKLRENVEIIA